VLIPQARLRFILGSHRPICVFRRSRAPEGQYRTRLSDELRETVDLSVIEKDHLIFIDQIVGAQRLRTVSSVGDTFPLYCTANGKAYLAQVDDETVGRLVGRSLKGRTPHTLTKIEALLADLKTARRKGVAFDREEHTIGISAVGVALKDLIGNYVALSVPVPTPRFNTNETRIVDHLLATKRAMEERLHMVAA
jgi:DNA-binding IclR family transcriptional regulator